MVHLSSVSVFVCFLVIITNSVKAIDDGPVYTPIERNDSYTSNAEYSPGSIEGFYTFVKKFVNAVIPEAISKEMLVVEDNQLKVHMDYGVIASSYGGLLALVIITLIVGVLLTLCGLVYCCCLCCCTNKKGGKHNYLYMIVLSVLLVCFSALLIFSVSTSFASNEDAGTGIRDLTNSLHSSINDSIEYTKATQDEFHTILLTNFEEFSTYVLDISVNDTVQKFNNEATALINPQELETFGNEIDSILQSIKNTLQTIKSKADDINSDVGKLNKSLNELKTDVSKSDCTECKDEIKGLDVNIAGDFPELDEKIKEIGELKNDKNLVKLRDSVNEVKIFMKNTTNNVFDEIDKARSTVNDAKEQLQQNYDDIERTLNNLTDKIRELGDNGLDMSEDYIDNFEKYRYSVTLVLCIVPLLVILCLIVGIFCGLFFSSSEGLFSKNMGGNFIKCGVISMYGLGIFLALTASVYLVFGSLSQKLACETFQDYDNSPVMDLMNQISLNSSGVDVTIMNVLRNCHKNCSIYETFNLSSVVDLDQVKSNIKEDDIKDTIRNITNINVDLDSMFNKTEIGKLLNDTDFTVVFNFDQLDNAMAVFKNKLDNLNDSINELPDSTVLQTVKLDVNKTEVLANQLTDDIKSIQTLGRDFQDKSAEWHEQFKINSDNLIRKLDNIQNDLPKKFKNMTGIFVNRTNDLLDDFINERVLNKIKFEVGRCGPLSLVINATVVSACDNVVVPLNGVWVSFFWSLMVFIPTIVVSIMLANQFKRQPKTNDGNNSWTWPIQNRSRNILGDRRNKSSPGYSKPGKNPYKTSTRF